MREGRVITTLLLGGISLGQSPNKSHKDYIPNRETAERVADAVLVAQYGEQKINEGRPLLVDGTNQDFWIVEVSSKTLAKGGGSAVWINKHSGCMKVMDHMK